MSKYPQMLKAIKAVRSKVCWKHNSAVRHLRKRKQRGHLPSTATLEGYERIILTVLQDKTGRVYRYWYNDIPCDRSCSSRHSTMVGNVCLRWCNGECFCG